jgi:hypothetical protein
MHHLPVWYTEAPGIDDRGRARLLGNGWRARVGAHLITLLITFALFDRSTAVWTIPREINPLGYRLLEQAISLANMSPCLIGPGAKSPPYICVEATDDPMLRLKEAFAATHPFYARHDVEPGLRTAISRLRNFRHDINRWRTMIIADITVPTSWTNGNWKLASSSRDSDLTFSRLTGAANLSEQFRFQHCWTSSSA